MFFTQTGAFCLKTLQSTFLDVNDKKTEGVVHVARSAGSVLPCQEPKIASLLSLDTILKHSSFAVLAQDGSRIALFEQTNILEFPVDVLDQRADLAVVDVSFVSLTHILPGLPSLLQPGAQAILLVKPQFEVGPTGLGRNGVVRNAKLRDQAVDRVELAALQLGAKVAGRMVSPVTGGDGNVEFLIWLRFPSSESL